MLTATVAVVNIVVAGAAKTSVNPLPAVVFGEIVRVTGEIANVLGFKVVNEVGLLMATIGFGAAPTPAPVTSSPTRSPAVEAMVITGLAVVAAPVVVVTKLSAVNVRGTWADAVLAAESVTWVGLSIDKMVVAGGAGAMPVPVTIIPTLSREVEGKPVMTALAKKVVPFKITGMVWPYPLPALTTERPVTEPPVAMEETLTMPVPSPPRT